MRHIGIFEQIANPEISLILWNSYLKIQKRKISLVIFIILSQFFNHERKDLLPHQYRGKSEPLPVPAKIERFFAVAIFFVVGGLRDVQ